MTFDINKLKSIANEAAELDSVNMSETTTGGGGGAVNWPAGVYRGRVVEVVEFGLQPQEYQGETKSPSREVRLGVMLFPNQRVKQELGVDVKPKIVRSRPLKVSTNGKAGGKAVFDRLNVTGEYKGFVQFIGDAYRFVLKDYVSKAGRKSQVIDWAATTPAIDDETGKRLAVPEAPEESLVLFSFQKPDIAMWNRLKIDGVREDGSSKNYIQETILSALDFKGSAVEAMLAGEGVELPEPCPIEDKPATPAKAAKLPPPPVDFSEDDDLDY